MCRPKIHNFNLAASTIKVGKVIRTFLNVLSVQSDISVQGILTDIYFSSSFLILLNFTHFTINDLPYKFE